MKRFRIRGAIVVAALAATVALATPSAAGAASLTGAADRAVPTAVGDAGWLRLGHFSPDTKAVDIRVTALRGGSVVLELSDIGYGDVSPYQSFAEGSYTVSMVPAGSDDWTNVAIASAVTVNAASATTVAAYGPTKSLKLRAFTDDLAAPAAGTARIRVIQASTITPTVDVQTSTGMSIVKGARAGSASSYTEVPSGAWTLELAGEGVADTADVDVASGSVTTLFVLDNAEGGLTILPVLDSAASPVVPIGGVQTGGGWLAGHPAPRAVSADAAIAV